MANKKETAQPKKVDHPNMKIKKYELDTLERPLNKEEQKAFDAASEDEQKKIIILKWVEENRSGAGHEISLEDEKFAGLRP